MSLCHNERRNEKRSVVPFGDDGSFFYMKGKRTMNYGKYKKEVDYTYVLGAYPTMEWIRILPNSVKEVWVSDNFSEMDKLSELCQALRIPLHFSEKGIRRLSPKENVYVLGIVEKSLPSVTNGSHVVLHEVSDMGNLGTIARSMLGFGLNDLVTVGTVADIYHPKSIRASMGAIGGIRHTHFESMEEYRAAFFDRPYYMFMLSASGLKTLFEVEKPEKFSLFFGNEGSGLPSHFDSLGTPVRIPQTPEVDSLNLTIACGIAMYEFTKSNFLKETDIQRSAR